MKKKIVLLLITLPLFSFHLNSTGVEWNVKISASDTRNCVELRQKPKYFCKKEWLQNDTKVLLIRRSKRMIELKILDQRFLNQFEIGYVYHYSLVVPKETLEKVPFIDTFNPCKSWHSNDF